MIGVEAGKLTVNGSAATQLRDLSLSGTPFMIYEFSGFDIPKSGTVTIRLEAQTPSSSYAGKTWTRTIE